MDLSQLQSTPPRPAGILDALRREPHWYACRTRARAEKQVDRLLARAGFETFLPLMEVERQWADRRKAVAFPLFPGYTFARFRLWDSPAVIQIAGLVSVVGGPGRPTPVRDDELEAVRRFSRGIEATGGFPEPVDWLEPGTPVQVLEGPFRGMRGFLVEVRGRTRVAVRLSAIRMALSVELDRTSLRRVA